MKELRVVAEPKKLVLESAAYRLEVVASSLGINMKVRDLAAGFELAAGDYIYRLLRPCDEGTVVARRLDGAAARIEGRSVRITGMLGGFMLDQVLELPADRGLIEERIRLTNPSKEPLGLEGFTAGMKRTFADEIGRVLPELEADRIVAIPFRHRPTDPLGFQNDFRFSDLLERPGREQRANERQQYGYVPSMQWKSEGWAWIHGGRAIGVFKFNQERIEFSSVGCEVSRGGVAVRFGGGTIASEIPRTCLEVQPGASLGLGVTRYQTVEGGHTEACYAFRAFLDDNRCRFPEGFNPPVHWNELYDNPEWHVATPGSPPGRRMTRPVTYTKRLIEQEAVKAKDYSCESLYLDPGWDTDFATFLWGQEWLGTRADFIRETRDRHGLGVSLHCPLATWLSADGRGVPSWPREAFRVDASGQVLEGEVCLGSGQYLDEAARRLIAHCADGVVYLMFDGNWWNGGCWNPDHGHPVPYTMEDHCRANLELARRIHEAHPRVLIEMHDMITGGVRQRYTPVYYKYGLPGSYDENWGFELMWEPMEDIRSGRAASLYYYNLGCNVPVYLHVDLRDDNEHCLVLWWYASTCRHLGIGGTHEDPRIAESHKLAMKRYRRLQRFFKEGDFYGLGEEIHVHALPDEGAFVVNLFNLSDESRVMEGRIRLADMGLDPDKWYVSPKGGWFDGSSGSFSVRRRLPPWSAQVAEVRPVPVR
ncbi:MAG: hypothetical protein HYY08_02015 [Firmicutes bacterium]|nr:hypothetical protein [Bacillota bacterium]